MKNLFKALLTVIVVGLFGTELFAQNGITYNGTSVAVGFNYNSAGNISTHVVSYGIACYICEAYCGPAEL